ncbi:MAG: hypothetical protein GWO24_30080, partial [Akkermansiaceae bacterium]|nr:hypothetical protein [Akkermansiaceae bacterium]
MWFQTLTGFTEEHPEQVRSGIVVEGSRMTSLHNGREMSCGTLETPTLAELRDRLESSAIKRGALKLSEVVGDVRTLH